MRKGNEWVLNARFNDAKFFFDEDAKTNLEGFLEKTSGILFQEKLGTVRDRATRLANLAVAVARATGADEKELEFASQAGLLCKADLSTGLVSELPSLQGLIGGEYARREGLPEEVCSAIASHYDLSKVRDPQDAASRTGARVLIADQLDKLAGYLGLGLAPSGSSDPFGLRRAVTLLIEMAWSWKSLPVDALDYGELLTAALMQYRQAGHPLDPTSTWNLLEEVFAGRYPAMMPQVRHDIMDAALNADLLRPRQMQLKVRALEALADETQVVFAATRPINIVAAARNKNIRVPEDVQIEVFDTSRLQSEDGVRLAEAVRSAEQGLHDACRSDDAAAMAEEVRKLAGPIDKFFESTMVMVEDTEVRHARLALLQVTSQALFTVGDFTKIVIEGERA